MNRRGFLGMSLAAAGMVFAPKFGRWHRQNSGLWLPTSNGVNVYEDGRLVWAVPFDGSPRHARHFDGMHTISVETVATGTWGRVVKQEPGQSNLVVYNGTLTLEWPRHWPIAEVL